MSNTQAKKVSPEDVQQVQKLIEGCLKFYLSRKDAVDYIFQHAHIQRSFTEIVWQKLEEENTEFFRAYHLCVKLKGQILAYHALLDLHIKLVPQSKLDGQRNA